MKRATCWLAPFVAAALACAPAGESAAPMVDTAADEAAVAAVRAAEVASINSGSMDMSHMTADAVSMPPGEPAIMGTEALTAWLTEFMNAVTPNVTYSTSNFMVSGDWAIEPYAGTLTLTPKDGGAATTEGLKGIHIYQRQADGSWKMTHDIWNSDSPPPSN